MACLSCAGVQMRREMATEVGRSGMLMVQQMTSSFTKEGIEAERRQDARNELQLAGQQRNAADQVAAIDRVRSSIKFF